MENCSYYTRTDPWYVFGIPKWSDTVSYILMFIGIIGNAFVIYIQRRLANGQEGARATPTNRLTICLATADLLTAIFLLPFPRFGNFPNNAAGNLYCHIIGSRYMLWVSFRASVYTLTTIAIERFCAIVYPSVYKVWFHNNYVKYAIGAIWICPLIIRLPQMTFRVVDDCGNCYTNYPSEHSQAIYGSLLFLIEFLAPFFIITYTSIRTMCELSRHTSIDGGGSSGQRTMNESTRLQLLKRRLTIMFFSICVSFMLLWTPDQLGIFLYHLRVLPRDYTSTAFYRISLKIAFLNAATTNPVIYSLCLPNFRRAMKDLLMCRGIDRSREPIVDLTTTSVTPSSA